MKEFEAELVAIGGRVDNLESCTAFVEDHQVSTTAKILGDVVLTWEMSLVITALFLVEKTNLTKG